MSTLKSKLVLFNLVVVVVDDAWDLYVEIEKFQICLFNKMLNLFIEWKDSSVFSTQSQQKKTREIFSFVNVNWHHSTAKWNLKFHVCTIMLMCDPYTLKARAISMPNANLMCYVIKGLHLEDQQDFIFVPQVDVIHFLGCFNLKQDSSLWRERRDKLKWKHWIETKLKDS